jgi:2-haloacid dehalogenase
VNAIAFFFFASHFLQVKRPTFAKRTVMQQTAGMQVKPQVIIFDVYETLLDMSEVERKVNSFLDSNKGYAIWFELFMQYCFADNCIGQFHHFTTIAKATMQMAGEKLGSRISESETEFVLSLLKHLPVHEGVQEGLSVLNDRGYRVAALTNSPQPVVYERMERTGLISYFEKVLSAEEIKRYKPSPEVYNWAAKKLAISKAETLLVSAHSWDIAGAAGAGMQTAYLSQRKEILYPLAPPPNLICHSLTELAELLESTVVGNQER